MPAHFRSALALSCLLLPLLTGALPARAGEPHLVKDLNPGSVALGSNPVLYGTAGARLVFEASDGVAGPQPFGSDGSALGTEPLLDECSAGCQERMSPYGQTGHHFFFRFAKPGEVGDLWATDGTRVGTFQVTQQPVQLRHIPGAAPEAAGAPSQIFFVASDSGHGEELWRSDGTPQGTRRVTDLHGGPTGSSVHDLVALGERVVFVADSGNGPSVWVSDGTQAGTRLLLDPEPVQSVQRAPDHLRSAGSYVYFVAATPKRGAEIWRTDGTKAGTLLVADLVPGTGSLDYVAGGTMGGRLLFIAGTPALGKELWISNGTRGGTYALSNFAKADPFPRSVTFPEILLHADLGNRALFLANDGPHGHEPWVTDGTRNGTRLLRDFCPGRCSSNPAVFAASLGGQGFFTVDEPEHGSPLWTTDGTAAGTRRLGSLCPGGCALSVPFVGVVGGRLAILVNRGSLGTDLWAWTPGAVDPTLVRGFGSFESISADSRALVVGRRLYLSLSTPETGQELWRSNLNPQGTVLVRDLAPLEAGFSSFPRGMMKLGSQALFIASAPDPEQRLWRTDGTEAGTQPITLPAGGPAESNYPSAELGGLVLFKAERNPEGFPALWRSDGTASGTFVLTPPEANPFLASAEGPVVAGGRAFFAAYSFDTGPRLWVTDGTVVGTREVDGLVPGVGGTEPRDLIALGNRVLFHVATPSAGDELWVSDGTAAGTRRVKDLTPADGEQTSPGSFVLQGAEVYFSVAGALDPREVWRTDGTAAGTVPALDGSSLPGVQALEPIAAIGTKLFLLARTSDFGALYVRDGAGGVLQRLVDFGAEDWIVGESLVVGSRFYLLGGGRRLWVSDGTAAGTRRVTDAAGAPIDLASTLRSLSGRLVFSYSRDSGVETWTSDGTPAGTRRIAQAFWSDPALLGEAGGKVMLRGRTPESGFELWAVEP